MLSEAQIRRYARHVLLRDVGGLGQERLLRSPVRVEGSGHALGVAVVYLVAGGTRVEGIAPEAEADADFLGAASLGSLGPVEAPASTSLFGVLSSDVSAFREALAGVYVGPSGLAFRGPLGCFRCFEHAVHELAGLPPSPATVLLGSAAALAMQRLVLDRSPPLGALALDGTVLGAVGLPPCEHPAAGAVGPGKDDSGGTPPRGGASGRLSRGLGGLCWLVAALAVGAAPAALAEAGTSPRGSLGLLVEGGVDARASAEGWGAGATDNGWFGGLGLGATYGALDNLELKLLARWSPAAGAPLALGAGVRNGHRLGRWGTFFDLELAMSLGRPAVLGPRIGVGVQLELHPLVSSYALAATHFGLGTGARIAGEVLLGLQLRSYLFE